MSTTSVTPGELAALDQGQAALHHAVRLGRALPVETDEMTEAERQAWRRDADQLVDVALEGAWLLTVARSGPGRTAEFEYAGRGLTDHLVDLAGCYLDPEEVER